MQFSNNAIMLGIKDIEPNWRGDDFDAATIKDGVICFNGSVAKQLFLKNRKECKRNNFEEQLQNEFKKTLNENFKEYVKTPLGSKKWKKENKHDCYLNKNMEVVK